MSETSKLLAKWGTFVARVERGYTLTIYDYTNELAVRDLLSQADATSALPSTADLTELDKLDERFRAATRENTRPIMPGFAGDPWWYYRIPLKLCGELLSDLRHEGQI